MDSHQSFLSPSVDHVKKVNKRIGLKLKSRREEVGLTLQHVALAIGVSYQQIQKYESGNNRISAARLYFLAKILNVNVNFFFQEMDNNQIELSKGLERDVTDISQLSETVQHALLELLDALNNTPEKNPKK